MFRKFITKHDHLVHRLLEILPGFFSWNIILFPYWGIMVIPEAVAYFIIIFNIYWLYQSFQTAITAIFSHLKIQASISYDWLADFKTFPDWKKVHHVVIIPTYKEPIHILDRTLTSLANQDFPTKQMTACLAMEEKEPLEDRQEKIKILEKKFGGVFGNLFFTHHKLVPGEVVGKSSNERFAAIWIKKELVDKRKMDINYMTVTSCDADHKYHPKHFAYLGFKFLDNPNRYKYFWQPAVMFYNNIWEIPAITRVPNTLGTIWNLAQLPRRDRLINAQNYSLSYLLLDKIGYWDPDKIPEDWGIFFKAYYKSGGGIEVDPIYLPLMADAAQSTSFWKTVKNQYEQYKRWAWGVSDDPWIIKNYFLTPGIPIWEKTLRVLWALWSHFSWPINWFVITIGITLPTLLNPAFARTALGYSVPRLSSFILTICLVFLVIMVFIDNVYKPTRPGKMPAALKFILNPLELVLMPIAGFFFSALPGLDAHTRLMLGKYIEYKVTEKV
jgi:cellulose synthase/poly-beta-1,6-N-acetylglucosamine synthase-like glycosyltransferase